MMTVLTLVFLVREDLILNLSESLDPERFPLEYNRALDALKGVKICKTHFQC